MCQSCLGGGMRMGSLGRIEWLDQLRGAAMFFVVIGHVSAIASDHRLLIYAFHMPLFFMISGATFRPGKYETFKACVIDKAKKLLVPYVLLFLVNIPLWYLNYRVLGSSETPVYKLLLGLPIANQELGYMSSGALWFLPALFLISVVFYGMTELDRKGKLKLEASMIICFALVIYLSIFYGKDTVWHWATVPMGIVFYFLGWAFMQNRQAIMDVLVGNRLKGVRPDSEQVRFAVVAIVICAIGLWAAFENGKISMHRNDYNDILLCLVAAVCLSMTLTMLMMKLPKIKILDYAGKNSIIFFGFHIALIRFFENLPLTAGFAGSHVLATAIVVFVLLVPVSMFVNKFCPFIVGKSYPKKPTKKA